MVKQFKQSMWLYDFENLWGQIYIYHYNYVIHIVKSLYSVLMYNYSIIIITQGSVFVIIW